MDQAAPSQGRPAGEAEAQVTRGAESELFVAGVVAYWAEGSKNKPWRTGQPVKFMNSDPRLIRLFLAWLRLVGISPKTVRKNIGAGYHGCLVVYVRNSAALNLQIEGWFDGLSAAAQALVAG